jgi:hypothetical protein
MKEKGRVNLLKSMKFQINPSHAVWQGFTQQNSLNYVLKHSINFFANIFKTYQMVADIKTVNIFVRFHDVLLIFA